MVELGSVVHAVTGLAWSVQGLPLVVYTQRCTAATAKHMPAGTRSFSSTWLKLWSLAAILSRGPLFYWKPLACYWFVILFNQRFLLLWERCLGYVYPQTEAFVDFHISTISCLNVSQTFNERYLEQDNNNLILFLFVSLNKAVIKTYVNIIRTFNINQTKQ